MNAVIYARYSSHGQTEQSIEGQLRDNYEWAKQQGVTVIAEYIDRALTGTKDARPDFQRMIEDASKKQFQIIIVWKLDRFARNRYDSAIYKAKLKKFGVKVVSVKENITDSPEGIILEGLLESMAEYYSANLSQNIKRGQRECMENGTYCGGHVPYGYKIVDRKLVADEKNAPVIRYVFAQYAQGIPKKKIIDELNKRGVRGKNGKPLTIAAFQHALSNPTYVGNYVYKGQTINGLCEKLIDDETFAKVQERLKLTARAPAAGKAKADYLLQGKAFCGYCGSPMVGESGRSKNGEIYYYYACAAKKKKHTCKKKNERKGFIEWYIVEQTMQYILNPDRADQVAKAVVQEYKKEFSDSRIGELEKAMKQIDRELDKLVDALIDAPKIAHQKIYSRMEALEAQKAELDSDLAKLRIAQEIQLTVPEVKAWLKKFCTGDPTDEEFRKRIIDVFINSVYLYDDRIIVFYNIRGGKQISYIDLENSSEISDDDATSNCSDLNAHALLLKIVQASQLEWSFFMLSAYFLHLLLVYSRARPCLRGISPQPDRKPANDSTALQSPLPNSGRAPAIQEKAGKALPQRHSD
ncbi:MAG: recombinase family protein [Clostridiales bacterium]|nr:recombinase family protein [Clostridiales bacterium]